VHRLWGEFIDGETCEHVRSTTLVSGWQLVDGHTMLVAEVHWLLPGGEFADGRFAVAHVAYNIRRWIVCLSVELIVYGNRRAGCMRAPIACSQHVNITTYHLIPLAVQHVAGRPAPIGRGLPDVVELVVSADGDHLQPSVGILP
jgi:hypothetical protein